MFEPTHRHKARGSLYSVFDKGTLKPSHPMSDNAMVVVQRTTEGWVIFSIKDNRQFFFISATLQTEEELTEDTPVYVYSDEQNSYWVRPVAEFEDGRFEPI